MDSNAESPNARLSATASLQPEVTHGLKRPMDYPITPSHQIAIPGEASVQTIPPQTRSTVSDFPLPFADSTFHHDPLLLARSRVERDAQAVDEDLVQALLATGAFPRIISEQRLASVFLRLEFDGRDLYRLPTPIECDGQFRIALDQAISFCKGQITNETDARKVTLHWEIRSRNDVPGENADAGLEDEEIPPNAGQEKSVLGDNEDTNKKDHASDESNAEEGDDDEVVFLGAAPVEQLPDAAEMSVDDLMESSDDIAGSRKTCLFFGHDERHTSKDPKNCRQFPGTRRKLRPHQLDDIRRAVEQAGTDGHLGALLAHPMGVGKTITYQGVIAVRRLAYISQSHAAAHPETHANQDGSRRCALPGRPFGIQCACETDGLTARFLGKFPDGATLIMASSSVAPQTVKDARAYFRPTVTIHLPASGQLGKPGSAETFDFINVVDWKRTARSDMAIITKSHDVRQLDLAIHLPGLVRLQGTPIETRWRNIVDGIGHGKGLPIPPKYLDKARVPAEIWNSMDDILADCSQIRSLLDICTEAFQDRQVYPEDAEYGPGFGGPKNVVVVAKWPIVAYLIQLWFEKQGDDRFRTALVHSGVPGDERQKIIDWFREFNEPHAGAGAEYEPKRRTKVFITTYTVSGTGLDARKVANYCVHFGVMKNVNEERQASGRVDRQGQPLKSFVYHLESMAEPLDQLTALMRDTRSAIIGEGGLLEEVVRLVKPQSQAGQAGPQ
ncbi:DNA repair helicase [Colletotrichum tabaci]|uniref:DNA repair helicase n=1 Tax=Colletotrichum tabaci TaxID=1209068 RepID=A0AAV9SSA5_9PEZI